MSSRLTRSAKIMFRITEAEREQLRQRAVRERRSLSSLVALIVSDALRDEERRLPTAPRPERAR